MAELLKVYEPVNPVGRPRLVFIHGLDGDIRSTWSTDATDDTKLWPKWLGEDTQSQVWLLGYGAPISRWKADAMALPRQATSILECLATEPAFAGGPVVLIGHSLGGLVIKTAIKQGIGRDVERHSQFVKRIRGVAFVGTPHFGSKLASVASRFGLLRANPQLSDLALDNANLEELNQLFLKLQKEFDIKVRVYSETMPLRPTGILRFLPLSVTVVSPSSSQLHVPGEAGTPVEADHLSICKPKDRNAGLYPSLKAFIFQIQRASIDKAVERTHGAFKALTQVVVRLSAEYRAASPERRDFLSQEWTSVLSAYRQAVADTNELALGEVESLHHARYARAVLSVCASETPVDARSPFQIPPSNPWVFTEGNS